MKRILSAIISVALIVTCILATNIDAGAAAAGMTLEWKGQTSYVTYHGVDDTGAVVSNFVKKLPKSGNNHVLKFTVYNTGNSIIYNLAFYFQENWGTQIGTEPARNVHVFPGEQREFTINIPEGNYSNLVFRMDFQTPQTGTRLSVTGIDASLLRKFSGSNGVKVVEFAQTELDSFINGTYETPYIPPTPTPVPTPVPDMTDVIGVKFSAVKGYDGENGTAYVTNGSDKGIFTEADVVDDDTLEKIIVVYNTGKEPFIIKFKGEVFHQNEETGYMSLTGPLDVPPVELAPGEAKEIMFTCDAEFTISDGGVAKDYTYLDMFVRFDILNKDAGKALTEDFQFVVTGLDNLKLLTYSFSSVIRPEKAYADDIKDMEVERLYDPELDEPVEDDGPVLTKAPNKKTPAPAPATDNINGDAENTNDGSKAPVIIIILVGAAVIVAAGITAAIIIIKKKQK